MSLVQLLLVPCRLLLFVDFMQKLSLCLLLTRSAVTFTFSKIFCVFDKITLVFRSTNNSNW